MQERIEYVCVCVYLCDMSYKTINVDKTKRNHYTPPIWELFFQPICDDFGGMVYHCFFMFYPYYRGY